MKIEDISTSDPFSKALNDSILLLSYRGRSRLELERKLLQKGYDKETVCSVIRYLQERQFIDDEKVARSIASFLIEHRRYGNERVRMELRRRGIERDVADKVLDELKDVDWRKQALIALSKRFKKGLSGPKEKKRAYDYLLRRGFDIEVINYAINNFNT